MKVAIIGGTGLGKAPGLGSREKRLERTVETPYGTAKVYQLQSPAGKVWLLPRHGSDHSVPPHRINYAANIWALRKIGVEQVLATAAVGALDPSLQPGQIVIADQLLDFTGKRKSTFFDEPGAVHHVDFTNPYCQRLRGILLDTAGSIQLDVRDGATYVAVEGPRYETAAEVRAYHLLGGHLVGMTGAPEAALAREAGLCYATVCLVTNAAAGLSPSPLTHEEVESVMADTLTNLTRFLVAALGNMVKEAECRCGANWPLFRSMTGLGGAGEEG